MIHGNRDIKSGQGHRQKCCDIPDDPRKCPNSPAIVIIIGCLQQHVQITRCQNHLRRIVKYDCHSAFRNPCCHLIRSGRRLKRWKRRIPIFHQMLRHPAIIDGINIIAMHVLPHALNQLLRRYICQIHKRIVRPCALPNRILLHAQFCILDPPPDQRGTLPESLIKAVLRSTHARFCIIFRNSSKR